MDHQLLAAIYHEFPECIILRSLHIVKSREAQDFFSGWLQALAAHERASGADLAIGASFNESATQTAFTNLAARNESVVSMLREQSAQIAVIARRTEPLSPSKQLSSSAKITIHRTATPSRIYSPGIQASPAPSFLPTMCRCSHTCSAHPTVAAALGAPQSPPALPLFECANTLTPIQLISPPSTLTLRAETDARPPSPMLIDSPTHESPSAAAGSFTPVQITHNGTTFHVLPLSLAGIRTPHDLILPPPIAFCNPSSNSPSYPIFNARNCSWHAIFSMIAQPVLLWDSWGPASLGSYKDIPSLWTVWDEGASVPGVGRGPPLRLVESHWGRQPNQQTNKGRHAAWRPSQNANVSFANRAHLASLIIITGPPTLVTVSVLCQDHSRRNGEWQDRL